jgi:protein transport protein SEC61 subunit alpha
MLHRNLKGNSLVSFVGKWQEYDITGKSAPIGGLAYYISPPRGVWELLTDPIHFIFYTTFVLTSFSIFSRIWIEIAGSAPRDVCK